VPPPWIGPIALCDTQNFPVTELVNLAIQIQAAKQLNELAKSVNQAVEKEAALLPHKLSNYDDNQDDATIQQIYIENDIENDIKETEKDINRIIWLVVGLFGTVAVLLGFVGCIAMWESKKNNEVTPSCTVLHSLAIGDGICDDRLNNPDCQFDGDDCCLHTNSEMSFCEICNCNLGKCI
jgi:hypothetical protein